MSWQDVSPPLPLSHFFHLMKDKWWSFVNVNVVGVIRVVRSLDPIITQGGHINGHIFYQKKYFVTFLKLFLSFFAF